MRPRAAANLLDSRLHGHRDLVTRVADHRIEGFTDRDDSRFERDVVPREPFGVAGSVVPLVMAVDDRGDFFPEANPREHPVAEFGVLCARLFVLVGRFVDLEHSDVVEQ